MLDFSKGRRCYCNACGTLFVFEENEVKNGEVECPNCMKTTKITCSVSNVMTK